jgi:N5-(carboxyethyl)ornithine synthase
MGKIANKGSHSMNTISFAIPQKENEKRRAILPADITKLRHPDFLFVEKGYGHILDIDDWEYERLGVNVAPYADLFQQDIICNPKNPTPKEYPFFKDTQTLFGWIHAVQGREITEWLLNKKMTAIAWEDMFEEQQHIFWRNNEIAGYAAVFHSLLIFGRDPRECNVAIIGQGNIARGARRVMTELGANVKVYDRTTVHQLRNEIGDYDIVINAVLWDVFRTDHIVYKEDLKSMKPGSMIIDISCDDYMGIETSHSTSIENPTYIVDGILHYAVDHTPALLYKTASESISAALRPFLDDLIEGNSNPILEKATIIKDGVILDDRIARFQKRDSLLIASKVGAYV